MTLIIDWYTVCNMCDLAPVVEDIPSLLDTGVFRPESKWQFDVVPKDSKRQDDYDIDIKKCDDSCVVNPYEGHNETTTVSIKKCNDSIDMKPIEVEPYDCLDEASPFDQKEYVGLQCKMDTKNIESKQIYFSTIDSWSSSKPLVHVKQKKALEPSTSKAIKKELAGLEASLRSLKEKFEFLKESLPDDYDTKELSRYITALRTLVS